MGVPLDRTGQTAARLHCGSTGTGVMLTPSTGINVVNKINPLRKPLLRYQYFNNGIKSKKMAFFDFGVNSCKTSKKWQKEGHFTTPVLVDPQLSEQV